MSFSTEIKEEIINSKIKNNCCLEAMKFGEYITISNNKSMIDKKFDNYFDIAKLNECCIKSIIKASFLSSGYINNLNYDYHLEIVFKSKVLSEYYINLLSVIDLSPRVNKRKNGKVFNYIVYIKDSEQISFFLSVIGASKSLLRFEEVRVEKEVKNNINRAINCETANLSKIIKSSVRQLKAIESIRNNNKYDILSDKLKEIIVLREGNKEASLDELSKLSNITKSGIKHRLDKIIEIGENL